MDENSIIREDLTRMHHQDHQIRPRSLKEYIGQSHVKSQMNIFIQAAKSRGEPLDHTLFFGPPGLGKTTLAHIIAAEMSAQVVQTSGPVLDKAGDLATILTNLKKGDVLFIDEIHRMNSVVEETLYSAMEDFELDIIIGDGSTARTIKIDLPLFTLVGATTRAGLLTAPFRDRFGISQRLSFYSPEELVDIVVRSAQILGTEIDACGAHEIAKRSRGTPRVANRLLRRVRDYNEVYYQQCIDQTIAAKALTLFQIDIHGLDEMDRRLLGLIHKHFQGGPVGLDSLSASLGEEKGTIEEVIEPYLIQSDLLLRTSRGRVLTDLGIEALGLD